MSQDNQSLQLQEIAHIVLTLAASCQGDSVALLALLRQLEELHREIREGLFQASLPDSRQALYVLLKDIESRGGWPYIERMRLHAFLENLPIEMNEANSAAIAIEPIDVATSIANGEITVGSSAQVGMRQEFGLGDSA